MSHESREAIIRAEEQLKQLGKELELDRYLRVDDDPYPSKRVFKLLKNLDLENVSFANVQSAGNPMYLEKLNRQELFDLVLVNFARLCVNAEWEGLLTAGGGTAAEYVVMALDATLTNERVLTAGAGITLADGGAGSTVTISSGGGNPGLDPALIGAGHGGPYFQLANVYPPFVGGTAINAAFGNDEPRFYPFFAAHTGDMAEVHISVSGASTDEALLVGFYTDDEGVPDELIGSVSIDTSSTGGQSSTSFSDTVTTARGTMYWCGYVRSGSQSVTCHGSQDTNNCMGFSNDITSHNVFALLSLQDSAYALPATVDPDELGTYNVGRHRIGLEW